VALASAAALGAERLPPGAATRISGVVFDSLAMRGLRGATVQIADANGKARGTGLETTSNDSGYFTLGNLPDRAHMLEARAVGVAPAQVVVDIAEGCGPDRGGRSSNR